jgi:hypothetical protein
VLLALGAALAASLVFAMLVAEHRDVDGRQPTGAAPERIAERLRGASAASVERVRALRATASTGR